MTGSLAASLHIEHLALVQRLPVLEFWSFHSLHLRCRCGRLEQLRVKSTIASANFREPLSALEIGITSVQRMVLQSMTSVFTLFESSSTLHAVGGLPGKEATSRSALAGPGHRQRHYLCVRHIGRQCCSGLVGDRSAVWRHDANCFQRVGCCMSLAGRWVRRVSREFHFMWYADSNYGHGHREHSQVVIVSLSVRCCGASCSCQQSHGDLDEVVAGGILAVCNLVVMLKKHSHVDGSRLTCLAL